MAAGMRTEGDKDDKKARGDRSDAMAGFIFILGFLDVLLAGMMVPLMPGIVRSFGGGVATLGLLHTLQGASKLSSAFVFGWVIDKFGFRAAMLVSLAGCALAYLPIAFASSLGYVTLGKLLLGCFRQTTFVCEAIVARTKEQRERTSKLGRLHSAGSAGFVVGPLLGGFLGSTFASKQTVALVQACAFCTCAVTATLLLPCDGSQPTKKRDGSDADTLEPTVAAKAKQQQTLKRSSGIKALYEGFVGNIALLWSCGALNFILPQLITVTATMMMRSVFASYLQLRFSPSSFALGLTLSSQGVLGMIFSFLLGPLLKYYGSHFSLLRPSIILDAVAYVLILTAPSLALFVMATIPARLASSVQRASFSSAVSHHAPPDRFGTVLGLSQSAIALARMIAPTVAGVLLDKSELHLAAACCVCCAAAVALLTWQPFHATPATEMRKKQQ